MEMELDRLDRVLRVLVQSVGVWFWSTLSTMRCAAIMLCYCE